MELAPGVHVVTVTDERAPGIYAPNTYFVIGKRGAALIDCGHNFPEHIQARLDAWRALGSPRIERIFITHRHRDHTGGAPVISKALGATIVAHSKEKPAIEGQWGDAARVGQVVEGGETFDLGGAALEVAFAPGHTLGSICLFLREQGALFTGDTVLGTGTTVINPGDGDIGLYIESLKRLLELRSGVLYPGHGDPVRDPGRKLRMLIAHRLEREQQVLDCLRRGKNTVDAIFDEIYPELEPRLHTMARNQIRSHLLKLEREGRVAPSADGATYALKG